VAMDRDREAWRTFRVDRMADPVRTGMRFTHVNPPDAAAYVSEALAVQVYRHQARVLLKVPYEHAIERISPTAGVLEKRRNGTLLRIGADDLEWLAGFLAGLDCKFQVLEPDELKIALAALGRRLLESAGP
jgi:predicted DNA-binding transcriptional regulator YafY